MNSKAVHLRYAFRKVVPSQMSKDAFCEQLGASPERLAQLFDGALPTHQESQALAMILGGTPDDYRDFVLSEDTWFHAQSKDTQGQIARLMGAALKDPLEGLAAERRFSRKVIKLGLVGFVIVILAILNGVWVNHKYNTLRPDAYRWTTRMYGYRDMAISEKGIEAAKDTIERLKVISGIVDTYYASDPVGAGKMQAFLINGVRYYQSVGELYEDRYHRAQAILSAPAKVKMDNRVFDIQTGQEIDLEDPNGGKLDLNKVRDLVRAQMRTDEFLKLADELAHRKRDINEIPSGAKWSEVAQNDGRLPASAPTSSTR